jgi:hypothetical protein
LGYVVTFPDGVTFPTGRILNYYIELKPDGEEVRNWTWGTPPFERLALHELGHVLGLRYPTYGLFHPEGDFPDWRGEQWSIMTYLGHPLWLGWSDVWSLRHLKDPSAWFTSDCPVDLVVTDSEGNVVSKTVNQVAGATYVEQDLDGDDDPDDQIRIPAPVTGPYCVEVIPEPGADPAQTVTLAVEDHGETTLVLDEVPIADLPLGPIVIYVDRTPPGLVVGAEPEVLVPANGQMVPIVVTVEAWDDDPDLEIALCAIESSQPDDADFVEDADIGTDDREFLLRASADPNDPDGKVYTITYGAVDSTGNASIASATVRVVEDVTPPELALSVTPDTLWPPNHKMVLITPNWTVTDDWDPAPVVSLKSISMDEGDETNTYDPNYDGTQGAGNTSDDIQVTPAGAIYVRAERSGKGDGRVYTITYEAIDESGNAATASATVVVPHDQR